MNWRLFFTMIAASSLSLIVNAANAQSGKKASGPKSSPQMCAKLKSCIERGMGGNNQYNTKYDRETATSWCNAHGYGC